MFPTLDPFGGSAWPPAPRGPLPPFDPDTKDPNSGAPLPVNKTLNFRGGPPMLRVRRENFCGIRVPGIAAIPGGSGDTSLVFAPFIDRYGADDQARIIPVMLGTGATHWTLSWPDSRSFGQSIDQFTSTGRLLKARSFFVDVHCFAKNLDPNNPDVSSVFPMLDAMVSAGAIDAATVAWETNLFCSPEWLDTAADTLSQRYPSLLWCLHFSSGYAHYAHNTGDSPGAFWNRRIATGVRTLKYQCVPVTGVDADGSWSAGMMQARLNDCLVRLCPGGRWGTSGVDVIAWETTAQRQFNQQQDELHGDLRGLESMCAQGPMMLAGYGNGGRQSDGSAL